MSDIKDSKKEKKDKGDRITIVFTAHGDLTKVPVKKESPGELIGKFPRMVADRIKLPPQQQLYIFVSKEGAAFIPSPDQTIGDLYEVFGFEHPAHGRALHLTYAKQLYQG